MTHSYDAIVVGAGLNGAATAFSLARKRFGQILVVDADTIAAGASGAAVGLLRSHYDNRPETELAARSLPYFRNWAETIGGDCGWMPTGFFRFVEHSELANMQANVAVQREFGEPVEILEAVEARRIAPEFNFEGVGAVVYEPASGTADNSQATISMLRVACAMGVECWPFTRAIAVETSNGRVQGIETSRGRIKAPVVVLAAGVGCKQLSASCGVELPLVEKMIRVAEIIPPESLRLSVSYMDPISDSWITPRQQGRALVAVPPPPNMSDPDDPTFSREDASRGLPAVAKRLPTYWQCNHRPLVEQSRLFCAGRQADHRRSRWRRGPLSQHGRCRKGPQGRPRGWPGSERANCRRRADDRQHRSFRPLALETGTARLERQ